MKLSTLAELYQHFDDMVSQDCSQDELFASSYLRGFIALAACQFGDDKQLLSLALADDVSDKVSAARTELTPQDREIVNQYWSELKQYFTHG